MSWEGCGRSPCPQGASQGQVPVVGHLGLCPPITAASLCCSLREALVQCGKEHQQDRALPKYYISYLLAVLNNNLALRYLHQHLVALVATPSPILPGASVPSMLPRLPVPSLLSPSNSVSSLHSNTAYREIPTSLQAALDRMQKKATQLLLEELLLDLQVCWSST